MDSKLRNRYVLVCWSNPLYDAPCFGNAFDWIFIDWISDGETDETGGTLWKSVNFGHIKALGVQASLQANMRQLLPGQHFFDRFSLGYTWLNQRENLPEGIVSQYALEYLKNKFSAQADFRLLPQLALRVGYRLQHRMGSYLDADNVRHSYASYGVLDARLQWSETRWNAYVDKTSFQSHLQIGQ